MTESSIHSVVFDTNILNGDKEMAKLNAGNFTTKELAKSLIASRELLMPILKNTENKLLKYILEEDVSDDVLNQMLADLFVTSFDPSKDITTLRTFELSVMKMKIPATIIEACGVDQHLIKLAYICSVYPSYFITCLKTPASVIKMYHIGGV